MTGTPGNSPNGYYSSGEDADLLRDLDFFQEIDPEFAEILFDTVVGSAFHRSDVLGTTFDSEVNNTMIDHLLLEVDDLRSPEP